MAWLELAINSLLAALTLGVLTLQWNLQRRQQRLLELDATLRAVSLVPDLYGDVLDDETMEMEQERFLQHARRLLERHWKNLG